MPPAIGKQAGSTFSIVTDNYNRNQFLTIVHQHSLQPDNAIYNANCAAMPNVCPFPPNNYFSMSRPKMALYGLHKWHCMHNWHCLTNQNHCMHNWHCVNCTNGIVCTNVIVWFNSISGVAQMALNTQLALCALHIWHCMHNWHCVNCINGIVCTIGIV